jgi:hypothetical protein
MGSSGKITCQIEMVFQKKIIPGEILCFAKATIKVISLYLTQSDNSQNYQIAGSQKSILNITKQCDTETLSDFL